MSDRFPNLGLGQEPFSTAVCVEAFAPVRPHPQQPQAIIYRERWMQLRSYYSRPAQNTPHPDLPQVYFADDVDFRDQKSGMVEWIRIYTTLPNSWNDFESYAYTFPGIQWTPLILGRAPFSRVVTSKLVNDYFMVGNVTPNFAANLPNYDDPWAAANVSYLTGSALNNVGLPVCAGNASSNGIAYGYAATNIAGISAEHYSFQASTSAPGRLFGAMFLRGDGCKRARLAINDNSMVAYVDADLGNGTVTSGAGASNATIQAVGDSWWRVSFSGNATNANAKLFLYWLNNSGATNYVGSSVDFMYFWRAQLVNGTQRPHATIPPTTTPDGGSYPIASADMIPQKFATQFLYSPNAFPNSNIVVEYISPLSSPNYQTYWNSNTSWVNTDTNAPNSYSIEGNDSTQQLWQGGIWLRQRRYVKAR